MEKHIKRNIYQKLVEVRKEVKYLQKTTDGFKFKYVSEGQILASIKEKMDEEGLWYDLEMTSLEPVECHVITDKQIKAIPGLRGVFEFKWIDADNPQDEIKRKMILQDTESNVKTCGGLLTYANKYFLLKFFSIPTDKLDPDAFDNSLSKIIGDDDDDDEEEERTEDIPKKKSATHGHDLATPSQLTYLNNLLDNFHKEEREKTLSEILSGCNISSIKEVPKDRVTGLIEYLNQKIKETKGEKPHGSAIKRVA